MNLPQLEELMAKIDKFSQVLKTDSNKLTNTQKLDCMEDINTSEKLLINEQKKRLRKITQLSEEIDSITSFFNYRNSGETK